QHGGAEVDQIARRKGQERQGDRKPDPEEGDRQGLPIAPGGDGGENPCPARWPGTIELLKHAQREPSGKHRRAANCDPIEMGADAEGAAADVIGLQAHQRQGEQDRNQCCEDGVLEERDPKGRRLSCAIDGEPSGSRHQTFSTSGRPRRPVGQKTRTRMSTTKTETSLYSTEKYPDQKASISPIRMPPSIAPGSDPMPPRTAAVNAFTPARKPIKKSTTP